MLRNTLSICALVVALAFGSTASAQASSDLTIGGTMLAGGNVTFTVTGNSAFAPVFLLGSETAGTTDVAGLFTLGIENPQPAFLVLQADAMGTANIDIGLPTMLPPSLVGFDIYTQAVSLDFMGTTPNPNGGPDIPFGFCVSDVESFQLN